ncbi:MAG TPA: nuclear transport factor 2 family protein [Chryseolinea sp.]
MNSSPENQQTQAILTGFYQSVAEKNPETIASFFADAVDWYIPKSNLLPWTGKLTKKSEIAKALQLLFDAHVDGEDQFEPGHLFIDGPEAAVFGKASRVVKKTGKRFTTPFCQRFTMAEGKITHFLMLEDTPEIEKAFKGN